MTTSQAADTVVMQLNDVVPYWRNPRVVTDEAVNAVAESIKRFGYQQPIVVDADSVIIIGHTRYAALRRLGVTEVPVKVAADLTPQQVKQLRVIDNRSAEFTRWDFDTLVAELDDLDPDLMRGYFPEVVPEAEVEYDGNDTVDVELGDGGTGPDGEPVSFVCPSCFNEWEMPVTREQIMSGRITTDAG